ncbi:MFS transporter [Reyranella sp.]|uniref:MFS transporter n=1 Tax=Reyranella sp. TaxID=1929291 RepID=UPI003BACDF7C
MGVVKELRPVMPILVGVSVLLSLSMGIRQSFGLVMPPLTRDIAVGVSDFAFAMSLQNLAWGFFQPFAGALATRLGFRPVMMAGSVLYGLGLLLFATAQGVLGVLLGAGLLIGVALACTAAAIALSVGSQATSGASRSLVLGAITASGSLGALLSAPLGQLLITEAGWRAGVIGFLVLALGMLPAAWIAGRIDRLPHPAARPSALGADSAGEALRRALARPPFIVMTAAYFVCGMQLLFIATHLPSYLAICGMDPALGAQALAVIGLFNVVGGLFFGWAGGRWSKLGLLGGIYIGRSIVLAWYFALPPTPATTLIFAALMGFLWLGVGPLVAGSVADMFGLRWQAMIQGVAFMSHQIGSFVGALGGGVIFDRLGSYDLAWRLAVAIGLLAGLVQVTFALLRPVRPAPA